MLKIFCCYAFKSFECLTQITNYTVPVLKKGQLEQEDKEVILVLFKQLLSVVYMAMDSLELESTSSPKQKSRKQDTVKLTLLQGGKK